MCKKKIIIDNFLYFLRCYVTTAKALYILGDLFESWVGDDCDCDFHQEIAAALLNLKNKSIPCYFIHGNRDFLLGKSYADKCGMILLNTSAVIELSGYRILLMHGDSLCVDDKSYKRFRKNLSSFWIQKLFLILPLPIRLFIANIIRNRSNTRKKTKKNDININLKKSISFFKTTKVDIIIHGHLHQLGIYTIQDISQIYYNVVLGSWEEKYGSFVQLNRSHISLIKFSFEVSMLDSRIDLIRS